VASKTPVAPVLLLWGEDAFLLREAALAALGGIHATEVDGGAWQGSELQDLATPSLFGEQRALLVTDAKALSKEAVAELRAYLDAPDPEAPLVLACTVADRGKPPAALVKAVEAVGQVRQVAIPRKELEGWLVQRAASAGVRLSPPAARALAEIVGPDAGQLVAALDQVADAFGSEIGPVQVHQQFRGLGEQKTWDLCDRAFAKDLPGAIRSLRSIEEAGDEAIMVLGGIASRLRDLIKVRALPPRTPPAVAAKQAGLRFEWQARRYQQQAANFTPEDLVRLHERITDADRALKSGGTADVVMPALIVEIAAR
jgi:DNA polymerase III subunit delta